MYPSNVCCWKAHHSAIRLTACDIHRTELSRAGSPKMNYPLSLNASPLGEVLRLTNVSWRNLLRREYCGVGASQFKLKLIWSTCRKELQLYRRKLEKRKEELEPLRLARYRGQVQTLYEYRFTCAMDNRTRQYREADAANGAYWTEERSHKAHVLSYIHFNLSHG